MPRNRFAQRDIEIFGHPKIPVPEIMVFIDDLQQIS
jgi:hypothetical protein